LVGCTETAYLPEGDPVAGKAVFEQLGCWECHEVVGGNYPDPSAIPPTYVALGSGEGTQSRMFLMESIIAPSHQFARPSAPAGGAAGVENVKIGSKSRMADYSESLTVRELFDLVSYLEQLQRGGSS
jgi:hypothetical protein